MSASPLHSHPHPLIPVLASALLAVALCAVTLRGTFIYDDVYAAHDDTRLFSVREWPRYLTESYNNGVDRLWRPLASFTFAVQWQMTGKRAWPMHLLNILLYAVSCGLVAALAWKLGGSRCAWVAGMLFAAHPIHVEAVAYLVGRCETLAAIGVLGALVLFIRPEGQPLTYPRVAGVFGCFLMAIFSKENGLLLPAMMLAWMILSKWGRAKSGGGTAPPRDRAARGPGLVLILLLCWTLAAYIQYRDRILPWFWERYFLDWTINPLVHSHPRDRWLIPVCILGRYAGLLIFPWRLSPDYSASVFTSTMRFDDPYFYLGIVALLAFAAACVVAWRKRSVPAVFCLGCLALNYFMVSNVLLIGTIFGERLMYLPSVFFVILFAMAVTWIGARMGPERTVIGVVAVLTILASIRTVTYAARWNNALSFYEISLREQPESAQLAHLYGNELRNDGYLEQAAEVLAEGSRRTPANARLWALAAKVALERGKLDDAERFIQQAAKVDVEYVSYLALPREIEERRQKVATQPATQP